MVGANGDAQRLKFELLARGLTIGSTATAAVEAFNGARSLTPHDYASTSGIILQLEDDVWVNAPIRDHNANFVSSSSPFRLEFDCGLFVEGAGLASQAAFWPQPDFHGTSGPHGAWNDLVVTHGDRARLSPARGCSMTCTFCNIPYDDPISDYALKGPQSLVEAARVAVADPGQPARHVLVSGGTPKPKDVPWMREFYATVLTGLPGVRVDLMMVPLPGLFDLPRLAALGLHELSINMEVWNRGLARDLMRQKFHQGTDLYLDFIGSAAEHLGVGRSRSMMMVGLEPMEDTLAGVRAIVERGGVPVLSPFRPDPATPLRDAAPPTADFLRECFERAAEEAARFGVSLGPSCPPCSHNVLGFATGPDGGVHYPHPPPNMIHPLA